MQKEERQSGSRALSQTANQEVAMEYPPYEQNDILSLI